MHARILVVEDSEEVRELLVLLLESDGFSVVSCEDADQALAKVLLKRPDLILTDLMLGATSGLDLITAIRSDLAPPIPPIVVCSGFPGFENEALQRGAAAFIPKPFEPSTILKTVATILARRDVAEHEREEAAARSRSLRAEAVEAARVAVSRLAPRREDLERRSRWLTDFLPRYFGFGAAFAAMFYGEELQVRTSSNEQAWRPGQAFDLALCRDMMETRSAILIPDLLALGAVARGPDGGALRFFTGVPLLCGSICVGALCLVDEGPHSFGADGYAVLEAFGRRTSALLSDHESEIAPLWAPSGLMTREGLCVVLAAELSRMERERLSLSLFVFAGSVPSVQVHERTAIAELGERRFAALLTREKNAEARQTLLDFVGAIARADDFDGGGLVNIEDPAASSFDARGILHAAESLLGSALRTAPGTIERIVIRREPYPTESAEPREDQETVESE